VEAGYIAPSLDVGATKALVASRGIETLFQHVAVIKNK